MAYGYPNGATPLGYPQTGSQPMPTMPPATCWGNASQAQSSATFAGKMVSTLSDIKPADVPTDGRPALFPNQDLTEIYLKSWGADGLIRTFRYVLDTSTDLNAAPPASNTDEYQQLASRLDQLEELIRSSTKPKNNSTKNEGAK